MSVRVDVSQLQQLLALTPADQNVMLVGRHGIGKSQIIDEFYRAKGMPVIAFFLGQMSDPGDLIGLMHKDEKTGRSEFLPPFWWPTDDQPVVLFLDELNRARPEILQSIMELALNKTLAGKRLPEGSVIISAVNEGDEYQLTDLDPALVSRFNLYQFAPTVDDWLLWAEQHDIDSRVTSFIQDQPGFLDGEGLQAQTESNDVIMSGLYKTPDRRAWARVSKVIAAIDELTETHIAIIAGMVGAAAATAFRKSLQARLPVTPEQLLLQWGKHRKKVEQMPLGQLLQLNEQIMVWLASEKCPADKAKQARKSLFSYVSLLRKRQLDEAVAHLVSMLDKPKYAIAMASISESMELMETLTQYLEGIKLS